MPLFTWRPRGMNISVALLRREHQRNSKDSVSSVPDGVGCIVYCHWVSSRPVRSSVVVNVNSLPRSAVSMIAVRSHR